MANLGTAIGAGIGGLGLGTLGYFAGRRPKYDIQDAHLTGRTLKYTDKERRNNGIVGALGLGIMGAGIGGAYGTGIASVLGHINPHARQVMYNQARQQAGAIPIPIQNNPLFRRLGFSTSQVQNIGAPAVAPKKVPAGLPGATKNPPRGRVPDPHIPELVKDVKSKADYEGVVGAQKKLLDKYQQAGNKGAVADVEGNLRIVEGFQKHPKFPKHAEKLLPLIDGFTDELKKIAGIFDAKNPIIRSALAGALAGVAIGGYNGAKQPFQQDQNGNLYQATGTDRFAGAAKGAYRGGMMGGMLGLGVGALTHK